MSKRKLNILSLSDKLKIVNAFESGKLRNQIQSEFGLAESTYYKIIKSKELIKSQCSEGYGNVKRSRLSEFPDVEKCLLEWIKQTLNKNITIDGPMLKQKSKVFANKLGIQNFLASNGWLEGFKKRHDISFKKASNQWAVVLPILLKGYDPNDVYNADETALFYKCLPDKTFVMKGEKCHGGKLSKDRLTILQCVNMTGTDKLPLLIIGKSKPPICFKGIRTLPVDYVSNTKVWMTKELFKEWLIKVDQQMKIRRKKIALFIDNCTAHTDVATLANVKVIFLPANTTSTLQPLGQGIIHIFKRFYRREVVKHTLSCLEQNINPDINVLLAMNFARRAWYTVSDVTVKNCFKKAGFIINPDKQGFSTEQNVMRFENEVKAEPSYDEWAKLVSHDTTGNLSMLTFEDFVKIDEDVTTAGEYTDDDIVQNCVKSGTVGKDKKDEACQSHILERDAEIPKKQVLRALETLHKFFECSAVDQSIFDKIYELEKHAINVKTE